MPNETVNTFQTEVWEYFDEHGRHDLPWRQPHGPACSGFDPYRVMVSELMLQQTQVSRVIPKYQAFLTLFPTVHKLAQAELVDVLVAWQGLGYNRRAKFLWQAARMVANELEGRFPQDQKALTVLPGVGLNTAGAIVAYAYDRPVVFIETNIRTVFIHHFFGDRQAVPLLPTSGMGVSDRDIEALVRRTLPDKDIRLWYWALMDYGTHLKATVGNKSRAAKAYTKQSPFEGSRRKVRGAVLRRLATAPATLEELAAAGLGGEPGLADTRLPEVLVDLVREDLVRYQNERYTLG